MCVCVFDENGLLNGQHATNSTLTHIRDHITSIEQNERNAVVCSASMQSQGAMPFTPSLCAKRQARPRGPLRREGSIHMWDVGCGRDAIPVHSFAVVLRQKGSAGGESKHCCCANIAVESCCIIVKAIDFAEKNGRHTHTHTHTNTNTHLGHKLNQFKQVKQ